MTCVLNDVGVIDAGTCGKVKERWWWLQWPCRLALQEDVLCARLDEPHGGVDAALIRHRHELLNIRHAR